MVEEEKERQSVSTMAIANGGTPQELSPSPADPEKEALYVILKNEEYFEK